MGKRVRSAKGEMVDFDILAIKAQIAAGNTTKTDKEQPIVEVRRQENFIDKKIKRKIAKTINKTVEQVDSIEIEPKLVNKE